MGIEEIVPFLRKQEVKQKNIAQELQELHERIKLYELIISRYRALIEREESKTIAHLKSVIVPEDEAIQYVKQKICEKIQPYIYEQHFLLAARAAHDFVRRAKTIHIPVDFWLSPREFLELGGDSMDKATFLCSLLIALENKESYVIVGSGRGVRVAVGCLFENKFYIFDPTSEHSAEGEKDALIEQWFGDCNKVYEFNNLSYSTIREE